MKGFMKSRLWTPLIEFIQQLTRVFYFLVIGVGLGCYSLYIYLVDHSKYFILLLSLTFIFFLIAAFMAFNRERNKRLDVEKKLSDTVNSSRSSDEQVITQGLRLAQDMIEFLADKRRDKPGYANESIPINATGDEIHQSWQMSVAASREFENRVIGLFLERFQLRLSATVVQLKVRGVMSDNDERHLYWDLNSIYSIDEIPQILSNKCHELNERIAKP